MPFELVTPKIIEKVLHSLDSGASISPEAAKAISKLLNSRTEKALRSAHRTTVNRASRNLSTEIANAKIFDLTMNPDGTIGPEYLNPLDLSNAQLDINDLMSKLQLPADCNLNLSNSEETELLGPIRSFHPPGSIIPSMTMPTPSKSQELDQSTLNN